MTKKEEFSKKLMPLLRSLKKLILSNSVQVVFIKKFSKPCYNETNINLEHVCLIYPNTAKRYFVKMKKPF